MDFYSFAPIAALLEGAYSIVDFIATLIDPMVGTASAAAAIVILTVLVRLALIPVGISQVRAEISRRRLAPMLRKLQAKYRSNPEHLQRKMRELYASEKASPAAGCVPTLLQAPVLSVVYGLFVSPAINGHRNGLLSEQLFDVSLGSSLVSLIGPGMAVADLGVFAGVLTLIAVVAAVSRRVALRYTSGAGNSFGVDAVGSGTPASGSVASGSAIAGATGLHLDRLNSALSWMPFLTVLFAAIVPLAAALYLAVSTSWTLAERTALRAVLGRRGR